MGSLIGQVIYTSLRHHRKLAINVFELTRHGPTWSLLKPCHPPGLSSLVARAAYRLLPDKLVRMHFSAASLLLAIAPACFASKLPVVDLGYELHQALSFSVSPGSNYRSEKARLILNRSLMALTTSATSAMPLPPSVIFDSAHQSPQ